MSTTLSAKEIDRAIKWIQDKAVSPLQCVICRNESWKVLPDLVGFVAYGPTKQGIDVLDVRGDIYPQVQMTCTKCGQTILINAVIAGVFDDGSEGEVSNG